MREAPYGRLWEDQEHNARKQAVLEAWTEYQKTGLLLSFEEADAWLARLEQGQDADPPECHR